VSNNPICGLSDLLDLFIESVELDLFRVNAFRIVGLNVRARDLEIRKQGEKLQFIARHGPITASMTGPLPLEPFPTDEMISEALQRLRDPERRLIEEFFWFWPHEEPAKEDPALALLRNRDTESATLIWNEAERSGHQHHASHNLAVMFHTLALDIEYAKQTDATSKKLAKLQYAYWEKGLTHWRKTLADEEFWNRLQVRVFELNDPRLTTSTVDRLRTSLPLILLVITAKITANAAARRADYEIRRYQRLITESGFDEELVEYATRRVANHVRTQISANCKASEAEANLDPGNAHEGVGRLLTQSPPLLAAIDALPNTTIIGDEARDEIATMVTDCLLLYWNEVKDWRTSMRLLEKTRPYAVSLIVRERLDYLRAEFLRAAFNEEPPGLD